MQGGGYFSGCIKMDRKGVYTDEDYISKAYQTEQEAIEVMGKIKEVRPRYKLSVHKYKRGMR